MKELIEKLSKEKILGWILILWGIQLLIGAVGEVIWFFTIQPGLNIFQYVGSGVIMVMGILFILLGWKVLKY